MALSVSHGLSLRFAYNRPLSNILYRVLIQLYYPPPFFLF